MTNTESNEIKLLDDITIPDNFVPTLVFGKLTSSKIPQNKTSTDVSVYYKITNQNECHYGFQYEDGLNVLTEPFNGDPYDSCCPGGLYFTDINNIFKFLSYGCNLRIITLPTSNPDFKMIKDPQGDKWRANQIILGERYSLHKTDTFQMLKELGANIHMDKECLLKWASRQGYFEVVKFCVENGADIHVDDDTVLQIATMNGFLEIVKYLVEKGAHLCSNRGYVLYWAEIYGHTNVIDFFKNYQKNIV